MAVTDEPKNQWHDELLTSVVTATDTNLTSARYL